MSHTFGDGQAWIEAVDAVNGTIQTIGGPWGLLRDVAWLLDGRSFLVTGRDSASSSSQIWRVSYPDGERHRVTADLTAYQGVSVSADGRTIATVQSEVEAGIFVAQGADREPRRLTNAGGKADGTWGIAWMPNGRLVYSSTASGSPQIWITDNDGGHSHQVTAQSTLAITPLASPDGAWVYFASLENGAGGIFRIAPDGTGVQRVALSGAAFLTALSPDGKTIYFTSGTMPHLMKISTSGGKATSLSNEWFQATDVTPDGTRAFGWTYNIARQRMFGAILDLRTGTLDAQLD